MAYKWQHLGPSQIEEIEGESEEINPPGLEYLIKDGKPQLKDPPNHFLQFHKTAMWKSKREEYQIVVSYKHSLLDDEIKNLTLTIIDEDNGEAGDNLMQFSELEDHDPLKAEIFSKLIEAKGLTYEDCANAKVKGQKLGPSRSFLQDRIKKLIYKIVNVE